MKKFFPLLVILSLFFHPSFSKGKDPMHKTDTIPRDTKSTTDTGPTQAKGDTTGNAKKNKDAADLKKAEEAKAAQAKAQQAKAETTKVQSPQVTATGKETTACTCVAQNNKLEWEWILVLSPLIIFGVVFYSIGNFRQFEIKDALTENEQTKKTIINPQYAAANFSTLATIPNLSVILPPTLEVTNDFGQPAVPAEYRPSISRYIAFLTSLLTIIIAVCMCSFFIYHYLHTGCSPDLSGFSTILIALGIGMAPYAVNKVSGAMQNKS